MSTDRPKRETMSIEEATVSNMWEIAALVEVVVRKPPGSFLYVEFPLYPRPFQSVTSTGQCNRKCNHHPATAAHSAQLGATTPKFYSSPLSKLSPILQEV